MPIPVSGDDFLQVALAGMLNNLGGATTLHLFTNVFTPTPSSLTTDFVEATFAGYAQVTLGGLFGPVTNPGVGVWQSDSGIIKFTCTGGSQVVTGWYIRRGSHFFEAAQLFDAPVTMTAGAQLQLELRPQTITQWIL